MNNPTPMYLSKYRLTISLTTNHLTLPPYKGSTFRGGFGHALRRVMCVNRGELCTKCPLRTSCIYPYIFETTSRSEAKRKPDDSPHPFIIEPPLDEKRHYSRGENLDLHLLLIGQAINYAPYSILAFEELGRRGIGKVCLFSWGKVPGSDSKRLVKHLKEDYKASWAESAKIHKYSRGTIIQVFKEENSAEIIIDKKKGKATLTISDGRSYDLKLKKENGELNIYDRGKYRVESVTNIGCTKETLIYDGDSHIRDSQQVIDSTDIQNVASQLNHHQITLRFLTPTRIKYKGKLTKDLNFEVMMRNLLRRQSSLAEIHCDEKWDLDYKALINRAKEQVTTTHSDLWWHDWERYSQRQDKKLKMGGFLGEITFEGDLAEFLPFIKLGEYLHIGKGTVYGLGKYEIVGE